MLSVTIYVWPVPIIVCHCARCANWTGTLNRWHSGYIGMLHGHSRHTVHSVLLCPLYNVPTVPGGSVVVGLTAVPTLPVPSVLLCLQVVYASNVICVQGSAAM